MATLNVLAFDPDGRPVEFSTWLDDLQLFLMTDAKDGVSLFDYVSGTAVAPPTTEPALDRSQWQTRDAAARLSICNHLPITERAHFSQHKTAKALYDAVVARDSSPATTALGRLMLPYLLSGLLPLLVGSAAAAGAARVAGEVGVAVGVAVEGAVVQAAGEVEVVGVVVGVEVVEVVLGAAEALGAVEVAAAVVGEEGAVVAVVVRGSSNSTRSSSCSSSSSSSSVRARPPLPSSFLTGPRAGRQCTGFHTEQRCFARLSDAWRVKFPDAPEFPNWAELLRRDVPIFDLDYEAILAAMYALSVSAEGDCYLCVPPDPGIALVTAPAQALYTFTLVSGASCCFFRDSTTVTPLPAPVPVSLADPSGGPGFARSSTVLPCPAVPSGELSGLHLPSFSTNLVATQCECRRLSHDTLLWHHRLGHPSLPRLRSMHSRFLVSGLPRSVPALPPSPAPPCIPCVEGRQRSAPHSSSFPPTEAPLQTLHLDVWGPTRVRGQGHERYFLLVVDDYTRYTTVFPLQHKGDVPDVLIPWIRATRLQLRERFQSDFPVLRLHSDRGGEFSSDLLAAFCAEHGIRQTFTLPASPQQNGVAERHIGLVMEVARTSMIHAAAPHFLWPFAVQYAAHQLNLWPLVSLPETSPTLLWTGKVGDASRFRVWGARAFVRDTTADKLSPRAIPCVFLGFVPDAPGWQFFSR
ncbi:unnamed protein product [Closterium sp. NIES-54]